MLLLLTCPPKKEGPDERRDDVESDAGRRERESPAHSESMEKRECLLNPYSWLIDSQSDMMATVTHFVHSHVVRVTTNSVFDASQLTVVLNNVIQSGM